MTARLAKLLGFFAAAHVLTSAASAQLTGIYVEYYTPGDQCPSSPSFGDGWAPVPTFADRGATCPGSTPAPGRDYGTNISFAANGGTIYRVYAVNGSQAIGTITVTGSGYTLLVGRSTNSSPPFTSETSALPSAGGGSIGAISASGGEVQVRSEGSVASVSAGSIVRIDARNAVGPVSSTGTIGVVRAPNISSVSANGDITSVIVQNWDSSTTAAQDFVDTVSSVAGSIGTVNIIGARMRGTITADNGQITNAVVSTVGIGPSSGTPNTIRARDGVKTTDAPSINANVDAKYNGGSGLIQTFRAQTGNFAGSLSAAGIGTTGTGFFIGGNLLAPVTITGNVQKPFSVTGSTDANITLAGALTQPVALSGGVTSGSLSFGPLTSTISIGGDLARPLSVASVAAGATIFIGGSLTANLLTVGSSPGPRLPGQVVINAANAPGGTWTGTALVAGTFLSPLPYYDFPSLQLGGGAVGLVPFNVYRVDSSPPSSSGTVSGTGYLLAATVAHTGQTPNIVVSHYGPIRAAATGLPVAIEYSATG